MGTLQWLPVAPKSMADARRQALNMAQWLARIANSYGAGLSHSHLALRWRPDGSIATPEFDHRFAVELRLPDLTMTFCEAGNPVPHQLDVEERSPAQVEAWILVELLHRGIDRDRFSLTLPYTVPGLMTGDAFDYSPESCREELAELTNWYHNAGAALARAARNAGVSDEVVCRPNDLHLAVVLPVRPSATGRNIRLGFAPGDEEIVEPYFYVSIEDPSGDEQRQQILTASQIVAGDDPVAMVDTFLSDAVASVRHQALN